VAFFHDQQVALVGETIHPLCTLAVAVEKLGKAHRTVAFTAPQTRAAWRRRKSKQRWVRGRRFCDAHPRARRQAFRPGAPRGHAKSSAASSSPLLPLSPPPPSPPVAMGPPSSPGGPPPRCAVRCAGGSRGGEGLFHGCLYIAASSASGTLRLSRSVAALMVKRVRGVPACLQTEGSAGMASHGPARYKSSAAGRGPASAAACCAWSAPGLGVKRTQSPSLVPEVFPWSRFSPTLACKPHTSHV
jgi:hypothetical protein